ncbi:4-hydroxybenzoate 3-monooxygenase [Candidatus Poriferisodalis sp.]|uniref:4-hydroxybenzoate 3-monooxygenase n=1 Tax=Candidatus Poriferisodalis sp. TaxID=3101277 RepID=UPI003B52DF71
MKKQVVIVGGGPAGALLLHILHRAGIDAIVLERQTREYVLGRIRAGVLEWGTVELLRRHGLGARMDEVGTPKDTINIAWKGSELLSVDTHELLGKRMMVYGQTMIQEDLYAASDEAGTHLVFEAEDVALHDIDTDSPWLTYQHDGTEVRIDCDYVAGCDGFHGASRPTIPASIRREMIKEYPFGWLGVMAETPPLPMLMYANHERGFALCSSRNANLARLYVQCPLDDTVDDWSDDRFWDELFARIPPEQAAQITPQPTIEKSIAPLRSFVSEPMSHGRLFLAGDAAHIVPPTGAKGLNLAVSDVHYLSESLIAAFSGNPSGLERYSEIALRRVWGAVRFSWWLTGLLHRFPDQTDFDQRAQEQELHYITGSEAAQRSLSEQYVGLPFEDVVTA